MYFVKHRVPALFIKTCNVGSFCKKSCTNSRIERLFARFRREQYTNGFPVFIFMLLAMASPLISFRHASITLAFLRASSKAVAFPIPLLAPEKDVINKYLSMCKNWKIWFYCSWDNYSSYKKQMNTSTDL